MRRTLSFNAEGLAPISNDELSSFDPDYTSEDTSDDRSAVFSVHSTLQSRTPKKWLTAWLLHESVAMYYCHVSRVPFTSSKAVEFAHILLPKASANQTAVVVEFILGMAVRTLCINSRLFIMPLLVDVHRMVDAHKIFFLPSKAVIDLLTGYFRQVLELRRKGNQVALWSRLREGKLQHFESLADGAIYSYRLLCSPYHHDQHRITTVVDDEEKLFRYPFNEIPFIKSHVSPFAISLNALRTLEYPDPSVARNPFLERDMEHWIKITQLLWRALLHKSTEDQPTELVRSDIPVEIVEHAASFVKFDEALQKLQDLCQLPRPTSAKSRSHTASSNSTVSNYHRGSLPSSVRTQLTPPSPTPTSKTHSTSQSKKGKGNDNATRRNIFSFSVRRPGSTLHRSIILTPTPASLIREQYLSSTVDSSASLVSKFLPRKANINFQKMKNQMKGLPGLRWKKAREPVRSISDS